MAQHMSLCRHYVRELRRSVLIGTPETSKRNSNVLEQFTAHLPTEFNDPLAGPSTYENEKDNDAHMSAFLRDRMPPATAGSDMAGTIGTGIHESPQSSIPHGSTPRGIPTDSNSPSHTVARQDIRASAEKILYTFLLPGAEREIILPDSITQDVTAAIEEFGRDDPEVFDVAKDYVFQAMERDAFPAFLRMKALGNLIPPTLMLRLGAGLISLFGAFWAGFVLIFLDKDRLTRCWVRIISFICFPCISHLEVISY